MQTHEFMSLVAMIIYDVYYTSHVLQTHKLMSLLPMMYDAVYYTSHTLKYYMGLQVWYQ